MRVLIFSADQTLAWLTEDAVAARGWSLLYASNLQEVEAQAATGVNAILTTPAPAGANLSYLAAEIKKWNPVPSLLIGVLEEKGPAESLEQNLNLVDCIIVVGKSVPKQAGEGKIRYCRATALGTTLVEELELLQSKQAAATRPKAAPSGQSPSRAPAADAEKKSPETRVAIPRDKRALLERICPYSHLVPAIQAALDPAMQKTNLFIDKLTSECCKSVLRCSSCNAANRTYGRYCRNCGNPLEFVLFEDALYKGLKVEENNLRSHITLDATGRFGMSSIKAVTPHKGFLWIGGAREGGGAAVVRSSTGERCDTFPLKMDIKSDEVLGIQLAEYNELPVLLVTTHWRVYRIDLNPLVRLNPEPLLASSPGCEFHYPAMMAKNVVIALEFERSSQNYYLRGGTRRKIGFKVTGLVPVHSDSVMVCTPDRIWLYDAAESDARSFDAKREIEVDNYPIAYDSQKLKAYVKTREGVCVMRPLDQNPWLEMCVPASQPNYTFCLNNKGDSLWIHDDNYIHRYSTSDFRKNFDSHSLQVELPFIGTPPVEQGGLLFVSTKWGTPRKFQLGVIDPRIPRFWPGEDADEMAAMPPRFNMGAAFLPVRQRGRLCLKRYFA
jgi:hypothetical protein